MKYTAFICTTLILTVMACAQTVSKATPSCSAKDQVSLRQIAEQWKDGYNNGAAAKVAALYSEDAYYLTQHYVTGIVHGHAAIQAYVQRGVDAHYHLDTIEVLYMDCSGDFGYTITRYESTNAGQKAFGVNIVIAKKIAGKWKIVAHESAVPDAATAIQSLEPAKTH